MSNQNQTGQQPLPDAGGAPDQEADSPAQELPLNDIDSVVLEDQPPGNQPQAHAALQNQWVEED